MPLPSSPFILTSPWPEMLAVFLPLVGFLIAGLGGRRLGGAVAGVLTSALMLVAAGASVFVFRQYALEGVVDTFTLLRWLNVRTLQVDWALRFDTLTAVMLVVVNMVSAMVHVYSIGYMAHDPHRPRFFAYLSFFTFAMLMLVTSDNLLQLFFGWEGVGLASYLLINFWFKKPSANDAAIKAFLVNRIGDFGFALGIMGIFFCFGSVEFSTLLVPSAGMVKTFVLFGHEVDALTISCLLLFMGAMGKSAQLGLHTWLPDAMEGPTPVSALIHAATMVTAGVFMLCRLSPLFEAVPHVLAFVAVLGALTAFVAATIALTQWDIKRVIAYSTMSQLGYMFFAIGVSAYGAALFHLMTHAFFKALLFLGAGSVIHALDGEQDLRKMGGLWRKLPVTCLLMWIGSLALAGVPFFAGFYSKDMILEAAWASNTPVGTFVWLIGLLAALMTAFYAWRLLFLTFNGAPRMEARVFDHAHESPVIILLPLLVLAVGAVGAGWFAHDWFVGDSRGVFWNGTLYVAAGRDPLPHVETMDHLLQHLPTVLGLMGLGLAGLFYLLWPGIPPRVAAGAGPVYRLFFRKWYFDELYDRLLVRPALALGKVFWKLGDGVLIDGCGPDGITAVTALLSRGVRRLQTGYVYHYAFSMVIALVAALWWFGRP